MWQEFAAIGLLSGRIHTFNWLLGLGAAAIVLQTFALREAANLVRTAYLVRMPLLRLVVLASFGSVALGPQASMLGGLLEMEGFMSLLFVGLVAGLIGVQLFAQINVVLNYGKDRMGDERLAILDPHAQSWLTFLTGVAPSALLVGCAAAASQPSIPIRVIAPICGLLRAAVLVFIAKCLQMWLTNPETTPYPPSYLIFEPQELPHPDVAGPSL